MMAPLSLNEFMRLVQIRRAGECEKHRETRQREWVLRPDQILNGSPPLNRRRTLATCPECDAVVDAQSLHPHSGLCPRCHELRQR